MAGKTLDIEELIVPDQLGTKISETYITWENMRENKINEWREIQSYIFATDTTKTTNSKLPWNNKTTIPKLCQIRDNLFSNYMASLFPRRKWLEWEGATEEDEDKAKKDAIENYIGWAIDRNEFYYEVGKLVLDYIDYGNCIGIPTWIDERQVNEDGTQVGYVGPSIRRIGPLDIVFNPTADNFGLSPKITRSLVSLGELKQEMEKLSSDDGMKEDAEEIYKYLRAVREHSADYKGNLIAKDEIYQVAGFDTYRNYLESEYVEVLTFYGDMYDYETDTLLKNHIIKVVDRHKVISKRVNPSFFGKPPMYHAGWRIRPDNLWAMGPLDNLVGMQYRIDHLENLKADIFDLIAFPPLKVRGYVEDFEWGPFERIHVGDDGDVEVMSPQVQALQADTEIAILEQKMEEMAGSPREAMGFRTPGEKTKYEVQRLENAASRIFQNKIAQFERDVLEPLLNGMLELARRLLDPTSIRIFDSEEKIAVFQNLTAEDITGSGRLRPVAARHFAEQATMVQNWNAFMSSASYEATRVHWSTIKLAQLWEQMLDAEDYKLVSPYIAITEQADAQRIANSQQEQVTMEQGTSSGLFEDDADEDLGGY